MKNYSQAADLRPVNRTFDLPREAVPQIAARSLDDAVTMMRWLQVKPDITVGKLQEWWTREGHKMLNGVAEASVEGEGWDPFEEGWEEVDASEPSQCSEPSENQRAQDCLAKVEDRSQIAETIKEIHGNLSSVALPGPVANQSCEEGPVPENRPDMSSVEVAVPKTGSALVAHMASKAHFSQEGSCALLQRLSSLSGPMVHLCGAVRVAEGLVSKTRVFGDVKGELNEANKLRHEVHLARPGFINQNSIKRWLGKKPRESPEHSTT